MPTIDVQYDEEVFIDDDHDDDGEINLHAADVYLTDQQAIKVADALYAVAGASRKTLPQNAVRAKDIPLNEALIRVAAAHDAAISFRYSKGDGEPVEARSFSPKNVKIMPDHVTFVGYDPDRLGFRSFRSDRIKGLVAVNA